MTTDFSSSDEMIRRAKESLHLETEDFLPMVEEDLAERGVSMGGVGGSMGTETPDEISRESTTTPPSAWTRPTEDIPRSVRARRVASSPEEHIVVAPRKVATVSVPVPPSAAASGSPTGSGRWMLIVGNVLLAFVIATWVILLIGLIDNPDDLGESITAGVVTSFVPFLFGVVLRRAGKRRGSAV